MRSRKIFLLITSADNWEDAITASELNEIRDKLTQTGFLRMGTLWFFAVAIVAIGVSTVHLSDGSSGY
jgi:hypothetical protein